jgi:hypothetical protein
MLPNARGPLIVDACLRIGYTTILLGTLGYFGLGLAPESPDWGTAIKDASRLLRSFIHPALPPTIALMSFVLGLNLLADAARAVAERLKMVVRRSRVVDRLRLARGGLGIRPTTHERRPTRRSLRDERSRQSHEHQRRRADPRDREPLDLVLHQAGEIPP